MAITHPLAGRALRRTTLAACLAAALTAAAADAAHSRTAALKHSTGPAPVAGTVSVGTCADDGSADSLRTLIETAQANTVVSLQGLDCPNGIVLTSGEIHATTSLVLLGPGQDQLTIDGDGASRVFRSDADLDIRDLTIANGATTDGIGGCVATIGDLRLARSTITGCAAGDGNNADAFGGGVSVLGNLTMDASTIGANQAQADGRTYGGGAYVLGDAALYDSTISRNDALSTNGDAHGGGLLAFGDVLIDHGLVLENRASTNVAEAFGGGVSALGTLTLKTSTVGGNQALAGDRAYGGGAYAYGDAAVYDSTISGNTVISISNDAHGGGMIAFGNALIDHGSVTGNLARSSYGAAHGGGVDGYGASILVRSASITNNTAYSIGRWSSGGGVDGGYLGTVVDIHGSTLSGNAATSNCSHCASQGGGAAAYGPINAVNSTISGNRVSATGVMSGARGGGLATSAIGTGTITLIGSTVSGNSTIGGDAGPSGYGYGNGGGIATFHSSRFVVHNSTIAFNQASTFGGGIVGNTDGTSAPVLDSSIVANNEAQADADLGVGFPSTPFTVDGGNNFVMSASIDITLPADTSDLDPLLLPLANNGGATHTHELAECSPAIDAGNNTLVLETDQRGAPYVREFGAAADAGAFELQPDADRVFRDDFELKPDCNP